VSESHNKIHEKAILKFKVKMNKRKKAGKRRKHHKGILNFLMKNSEGGTGY